MNPTTYDKRRFNEMEYAPCPSCQGYGEIAWCPKGTPGSSMNNPHTRIDTCRECDGTGSVLEYRWHYES